MGKKYYWMGVKVEAINHRKSDVLGITIVDLIPVSGSWEYGFWPAKRRVPLSILRTTPLPKIDLYLSYGNA